MSFQAVERWGVDVDFERKETYRIDDLLKIMSILRGEGGCPWDREQTHQSIRRNFIEETYEVAEAIDNGDRELLQEELGDVLLQVVFHAQMEAEQDSFDFDDVCDGICKKLILRHPHIFGDVSAGTAEEVLKNWEEIKKKEKGQKTQSDAVLAVPKTLPALMRSAKVQQRAAKTGFDYPALGDAVSDLESELAELKEAVTGGNPKEIDEEFGDLLFSCVNISRFLHLDAEESLTRSTEKFIRRFAEVEKLAQANGTDLKAVSLEELNKLWAEAKTKVHL